MVTWLALGLVVAVVLIATTHQPRAVLASGHGARYVALAARSRNTPNHKAVEEDPSANVHDSTRSRDDAGVRSASVDIARRPSSTPTATVTATPNDARTTFRDTTSIPHDKPVTTQQSAATIPTGSTTTPATTSTTTPATVSKTLPLGAITPAVPTRPASVATRQRLRLDGALSFPGDVESTYPLSVADGNVDVVARWAPTATADLAVTCNAGSQEQSTTGGATLSVQAVAGHCTVSIAEPPGEDAAIAYVIRVSYRVDPTLRS